MDDRVMPTIEDLQKILNVIDPSKEEYDNIQYLSVYKVQAQAMLHICLELEQLNNNLEALRGHDARH